MFGKIARRFRSAGRSRPDVPTHGANTGGCPPRLAWALGLAEAGGSATIYSEGGHPRAAPTACSLHHGQAVSLNAGETLRTPLLRVTVDTVLLLDVKAGDGARLDLCFLPAGGARHAIAKIAAHDIATSWSLRELHGQVGHLEIRLERSAPRGTVTLAKLQVAEVDQTGRVNALDGYACRMQNELQHFDASSYTHAMYAGQGEGNGTRSASGDRTGQPVDRLDNQCMLDLREHVAALSQRASVHLDAIRPNAGEDPFHYAMRALQSLLPTNPPDFLARADTIEREGPLRMLSICAGAARVERSMLDRCTRPIHLTLLDASPDLVARAADELSDGNGPHEVRWAVADVNAGFPGDDRYDVIVCVSALHHVSNLEGVLAEINMRLSPGGEFWSIGEQIGRNGNRLWPRDQRAADAAFGQLPERLRHNHATGRIDATLETRDFSSGCFEGIRSEELERMLSTQFVPVDVYRRNAFLWRCVDPTYADNYDLTAPDDLACLRQLITAEAVHWAMGGTATELHGIYRKKDLAV